MELALSMQEEDLKLPLEDQIKKAEMTEENILDKRKEMGEFVAFMDENDKETWEKVVPLVTQSTE